MEKPRQTPRLRAKLLQWPLLSLFIVWQVLYLPRLRDSPPWYGDETGTLLMGKELLRGNAAIGSFRLTYWHPYYPYQPAFSLFAAAASALTGGDILGARFLNATIALAIAALLYLQGRRRLGSLPAWFGAMAFLCYFQSVIHFRWVYPHNGLALGTAIAIVSLLRKRTARQDWRAGAGLALQAGCHPLVLHGVIAAIACRLKTPSAWSRILIPPAAVLLLTGLFVTWKSWPHFWLWEDLVRLGEFYRSTPSKKDSWISVCNSFLQFFFQDLFHFGALVGMVVSLRSRAYPIAIWGLIVSVLLLQNRQNLTVFYYQVACVLPVYALAWASLLAQAAGMVRHRAGRKASRWVMGTAFLLPLISLMTILPAVVSGHLQPRNHHWVTQSTAEVEAAAQWLNERTAPDDLVIANANIAWLLKARTADWLQATLWQGNPTEYFPKGIGRERFRFPAGLSDARFAVVGDIDQRYTFHLPSILENAERAGIKEWTVVWSGRHYVILQRPDGRPAPGPTP